MTALIFVLLLVAAVLFGLAAAGVGDDRLVLAGLCLVAVAMAVAPADALF
jgi:hypothetical protein